MKYIHVLMMCLALTLSMSVQAQKQKKEKEPKDEKVQKEKKQKESKQKKSKKKDQFVSFADVKVAKKGTVEYNAQRQAAVQVMDSLLLHTRTTEESRNYFGQAFYQPDLEKFADMICAKFDNDPVLMDSIAAAFFGPYSNADLGEKRFAELKKMHPNYGDVYLNEGRLFHGLVYRRDENGKMKRDSAMLNKARVQFDSAKVVMPNSAEPYMIWMRLQAKYNEQDADAEIEKLISAHPDYPAHLEAARYYDFIAVGNYNYLLPNALRHYEQVDSNSMKASDILNYSLLLNRVNGKPYWVKGLNLAKFGLNKSLEDKEVASLYRAGLWNAGKAELWTDAINMAEGFFEKADTMQKQVTDYKWYAKARFYSKEYKEALELYQQEVAMPDISDNDYSSALSDMIDCYRNLGNIDDAVRTFAQFESFRKAHGMEMEAAHYQVLFNSYEAVFQDSAYSVKERMAAYEKYDSIVRLAIAASPNYTGLLSFYNLNNALSYAYIDNMENGINSHYYAHPKVKEVASYAINVNKDYQSTLDPSNVPNNDTYYLMYAYDLLLEHYANSEDLDDDAFKRAELIRIAEIMTTEMPLAVELPNLSQKRSTDYTKWTARAEKILEVMKKSGKKKKGGR